MTVLDLTLTWKLQNPNWRFVKNPTETLRFSLPRRPTLLVPKHRLPGRRSHPLLQPAAPLDLG